MVHELVRSRFALGAFFSDRLKPASQLGSLLFLLFRFAWFALSDIPLRAVRNMSSGHSKPCRCCFGSFVRLPFEYPAELCFHSPQDLAFHISSAVKGMGQAAGQLLFQFLIRKAFQPVIGDGRFKLLQVDGDQGRIP